MGIVRKQSAYSSLFIYIGFAIGAVDLLVLFQQPAFTKEAFGLTRLMIDFAIFFSALSTFGSLNALYKFTPFYKAHLKTSENDFPYLVVCANVIGAALFVICSIIFKGYLERKFGNNSPLFITHYYLVIPFTISLTCFMVLEAFCWMLQKTVASNIAREVMYRIAVTISICLYLLGWISIETFFVLFSLSYVPSIIMLLIVVAKTGGIKIYSKISRVTQKLYKKILVFISYHYSSMLIAILPHTIDGILIAGLSKDGLENLAAYSIPVYLVAIMDVPMRSMSSIMVSLISEAWKNKDLKTIQNLYKKSSLNLLVIGLGLFGLMYVNIDNLVRLQGGRYEFHLINNIFLILSLAKLVDLGLGMNAHILTLSSYWRVDFYTSLAFISINVILDYFLIKSYGALGAAYGSAIALICYNLFRLINLWILFKIQPFSLKTLLSVVFAVVAIGITIIIPILNNLFLDGILRCIVFVILYVPAVLYFKVSPDINNYYQTILNKISFKK